MVTTKKIKVGEYVVEINHDTETNLLVVSIYDELGEVIESVEISDNEEYDEDNPFGGIL
jgi:hypothetical protein